MNDKTYRLFVRYPLWATLASLLVMGIFSKRGVIDYHRIVKKNTELDERLANVEQMRLSFAQQVDALKQSVDEQERLVRSSLGYVKSDELIVEFE